MGHQGDRFAPGLHLRRSIPTPGHLAAFLPCVPIFCFVSIFDFLSHLDSVVVDTLDELGPGLYPCQCWYIPIKLSKHTICIIVDQPDLKKCSRKLFDSILC